jgi:hypothetical protein
MTQKELRVRRVLREGKEDFSPPVSIGPFLVDAGRPDHSDAGRVMRYPGDNPTLFREFAALDSADLGALVVFANEYGWLGRKVMTYCDPAGRVGDTRFATEFDDENTILPAEAHADWVRAVSEVQAAVDVFDGLAPRSRSRSRPARALRDLFRWEGEGSWGEAWLIDTHPGATGDPGRVREIVFGDPRASRLDDVGGVARRWLIQTINQHLDRAASPVLVLEDDGKLSEHLHAATLLAALWVQLYGAVTGGKGYEQCKGCGKWFEVSNARGGRTVRRVYCNDACRVRVYRSRRERAAELAGEGLKPAAIVAQLAKEGHETDLATVKTWVKTAKGRN